MDKSTSTLRFQVWTERVRECHTSGMTVKAWCEQNNINQKTYYYWQPIIKGLLRFSVNHRRPLRNLLLRFYRKLSYSRD